MHLSQTMVRRAETRSNAALSMFCHVADIEAPASTEQSVTESLVIASYAEWQTASWPIGGSRPAARQDAATGTHF